MVKKEGIEDLEDDVHLLFREIQRRIAKARADDGKDSH